MVNQQTLATDARFIVRSDRKSSRSEEDEEDIALAVNSHFQLRTGHPVSISTSDADQRDNERWTDSQTVHSPAVGSIDPKLARSDSVGAKISVEGRKLPFPAFSKEIATSVRKCHASIPNYEPTPLLNLEAMAIRMGIHKLSIKDESKRFGLNAFKVLGSSYAIAKKAKEKIDLTLAEDHCCWDEMKTHMSGCPLITATDGNHGYGVAWLASQLPSPCHVLMPAGSAAARVERTRKLGAHVQVTSVGYDQTVEHAVSAAKEKDWLLVQDTSFDGYEEIPLDIMQGYMTIFHEALEQVEEPPTHVFLQAGVGSFAGGLLAYLRNVEASSASTANPSFVTIVEASGAECLFKSANREDGNAEIMTTPCDTIMAGLNCSSPCTVAWPILRTAADAFLCCSDDVAAAGMKLAYNPIGSDPSFISGESGAVTLGALYKICCEEKYSEIKKQLKINHNSRVLLVSTEGDTDPEGFHNIVHGGTR